MRSILCLLVVGVFATTAAAQFKNGVPKKNTAAAEDATQKKAANAKGNAGKAGAAEQAAVEAEVVDKILAAMDLDQDGVVSQKEMTKALAALRKVPKDKQGNITVPEGAVADPNAAAGVAQGPNGAGAPADGRNVNNEAMGRFMQLDANHDGVLSPNEVPQQQQAMLRSADTNRDGVIDASELQTFSRRMGDRMKGFAGGVNTNGAGAGQGNNRKP